MDESAVGYRRTPCFMAEEEHSDRVGSSTSVDSSTSKNFPRSSGFYASMFEYNDQPHFLDSCSLCGKPLGAYSDIFMYRGDTPFCSEDCREEQIEADEAEEKRKRNINNKQKHTSSAPSTSQIQDCSVRSSTVAVS